MQSLRGSLPLDWLRSSIKALGRGYVCVASAKRETPLTQKVGACGYRKNSLVLLLLFVSGVPKDDEMSIHNYWLSKFSSIRAYQSISIKKRRFFSNLRFETTYLCRLCCSQEQPYEFVAHYDVCSNGFAFSHA